MRFFKKKKKGEKYRTGFEGGGGLERGGKRKRKKNCHQEASNIGEKVPRGEKKVFVFEVKAEDQEKKKRHDT